MSPTYLPTYLPTYPQDKTKETIDDEGWLHTGDIAEVDEDGFWRMTGRIKELIITAGGENIVSMYVGRWVGKGGGVMYMGWIGSNLVRD